MKTLISILFILLSAFVAFGQKDSVTVETAFGSTSPVVKKLPLPAYPKIAEEAHLSGRVTVDVTLDEKGMVTSAENATGPYPVCQSVKDLPVWLLRNSAVEAARKSRFQPIDGQSVGGMKGKIIYDFEAVDEITVSKKDAKPVKEMRLDRLTILGSPDTAAGVVQPGESGSVKSEDTTNLPKTVSGGLLKGTAQELGKPIYPRAARAVRAIGTVNVQVLIYEDGTVHTATAISGHPLLRDAAEIAACGSKFTPTLLQGNPVKVFGVITYNFIP